ncbi:Gfo/Idh/MocA family oxidoreductase [Dictyobacter formicarum]|uniref:Oxidoreductase n=1 Tax=Dictyobacter formicarum TaxID=2778368 RepID=A0ABQ3VCL4_9CHLR|nr:Gfo/Idh/MocA family oxidoreductase [Dictyobacter formicarum]GHO83499.1 oxidoreductase [Dictyobacter formicarum]
MAFQESLGTSPVRVAIIGYGLAGSVFHAPLVDATPDMKVAAIVTGNKERQQSARKRYPNAKILSQVADLWQNASNYDLAVVATSNNMHVPLGIAALRAGLPVVIDKPMAATVNDAQQLLTVSHETGQLLTVFQNRRWDNDFLTVRKILDANLLGPIIRFESRFERYRPTPRQGVWRESADPQAAGGQLYDLGSHLIDQALYLFGKPKRVYAEMFQRRPGAQVDDDSFVALQFASGITAHLWMSQVARIAGQRMRVSGLNGTYEKWGLDPQEDALRTGKQPGDPDWGREPRERWGHLSTNLSEDGVHFDGPIETVPGAYERYYAGVRDALTKGTPLPVDPNSVLEVIRVIEAAQTSAREQRTVTIS